MIELNEKQRTMLSWKDVILLRWALNTRPVVHIDYSGNDGLSTKQVEHGRFNDRHFMQYLISNVLAFCVMCACAWAIFVTTANVLVLIICIPTGGVATLLWLVFGFLMISEILFGSR